MLLIDSNQPRGQWKLGHVIKTFPGEDGLVRVVEVQTETGIYKRAIHRLCLLERAPRDSPTIESSSVEEEKISRSLSPTQSLLLFCFTVTDSSMLLSIRGRMFRRNYVCVDLLRSGNAFRFFRVSEICLVIRLLLTLM